MRALSRLSLGLLAAGLLCTCDLSWSRGPQRAFVSSVRVPGNEVLGVCQDAADEAGLGGRWVEYVSTSAIDAVDRVTSFGPWLLLDGTQVFADRKQMIQIPDHAIDIDEHGARVTVDLDVWTGTELGSMASAATCGNWRSSSRAGLVGRLDSIDNWTQDQDRKPACTQTLRVYCFEL
jgi:hypothetical protein